MALLDGFQPQTNPRVLPTSSLPWYTDRHTYGVSGDEATLVEYSDNAGREGNGEVKQRTLDREEGDRRSEGATIASQPVQCLTVTDHRSSVDAD
jgi:hypothetical protein